MSRTIGSDRCGDDAGSVMPLLTLVLVAFVMVTAVIVTTTSHHVDVARARWAADSAALAAAAAGPGEAGRAWAETMADANGADLVRYGTVRGAGSPSQVGWAVVVEVRVGAVTVQAAASRVTAGSGSRSVER